MAAKKNNALNSLPEFIWGEAVLEMGFDPHDYLIHTRYPRFICRVYETEESDTELGDFDSDIGLHPQTGEQIYITNRDIGFKDFIWLDKGGIPPSADVKSACDRAFQNFMLRDDEYGLNSE